jgi:hypothetical protein
MGSVADVSESHDVSTFKVERSAMKMEATCNCEVPKILLSLTP